MHSLFSTIWQQSEPYRQMISTTAATWWPQPLKKWPITTAAIIFFFFVLLITALLSSSWINSSTFSFAKAKKEAEIIPKEDREVPKRIEIPLKCSIGSQTQTCPGNYPTTMFETDINQTTCPDFLRWIHEDLRPFKATGITREMVERAKRTAHFRVAIVKGKVYVEKYKKSIQTRDEFTLWGILQLLRRYPGRLPDLELMFDCNDRPVIRSRDYPGGPNATAPPPLFRYCGDRWTMDIVFPDWSFWGWAEINIKPWESILKEVKEGNKRIKWMEREPFAYWKGNPFVAGTRRDLLKCNVSDKYDWNARLFVQDWNLESKQGFKQSDLASQCTYRYKIYIEGWAWSVSEKYILACDSATLLVRSHYYDFFIRGLQPLQHYWPIRDDDKCRSLKFAVDWANNHTQKAQAIGKAASDFIQQDLSMDYVYDYMFHLLNEYSKLLTFKPEIPKGAVEFCSETMACNAQGLEKKFMMESLVKGPSITSPCTLPPPYEPHVLDAFVKKKLNSTKQVETWEKMYWDSLNKEP
ncbi:hypothetical protein ACSBR2_038043 [Camellia fascicularis]